MIPWLPALSWEARKLPSRLPPARLPFSCTAAHGSFTAGQRCDLSSRIAYGSEVWGQLDSFPIVRDLIFLPLSIPSLSLKSNNCARTYLGVDCLGQFFLGAHPTLLLGAFISYSSGRFSWIIFSNVCFVSLFGFLFRNSTIYFTYICTWHIWTTYIYMWIIYNFLFKKTFFVSFLLICLFFFLLFSFPSCSPYCVFISVSSLSCSFPFCLYFFDFPPLLSWPLQVTFIPSCCLPSLSWALRAQLEALASEKKWFPYLNSWWEFGDQFSSVLW